MVLEKHANISNMTTRYNISIGQDGIWAGQGHYDHADNGDSVSGNICDCDAILGGNQEAAEEAYSAIEDAITDMDSPEDGEVEVKGKSYTWTLEAQS